MKIIVLGVPHTKTTRECCICPFTMKAWSQCRMFHRRGHEVIHLGVEGSDPECSENVVVVSGEEWKRVFQRPASRSRQEEGRKRAGDAIDVHGTQQRSPGIQTYAER